MFETAELGRKVRKCDFEAAAPSLRTALLAAQRDLRAADLPMIVVFAGVDGAGKGETVNLLHEWLDPRGLITRAYGEPSDEERERPEFWRYWRDLPPRGKIGIFLSSWYSRPVLARVYREIDGAALDARLDRIVGFEQALADDGALILKFWMHLGRKAQKRRFEALERDRLQRWRVTEKDWEHYRKYDRFIATAERTIARTSTGDAPWRIVEGVDPCYRYLTVANALHEAMRKRLATATPPPAPAPERPRKTPRAAAPAATKRSAALLSGKTILQAVDLDQALAGAEYERRLERGRGELNRLYRKARARGISAVLVFEGWDAAGKGGAIRRLVSALDARDYQVLPIAAPTDEERARHYLWRFWRHLARAGRVTIFDRSWYGRVLVERVEGFACEEAWRRAYAEINAFEQQLGDHGIVLVKYWLHTSKEEQLRRFREREKTPFKRYKITAEDWRNRDKWEDYELAVNEMVERTSTRGAPWTLVPANDKRFARVRVIETLCERFAARLGRRGPR
jgi:polyphosphate:AMP phosphotransferase